MPFKTIRRNSLASNLKHHTISRSAVLSIASITNRYQALATQCLPLLQTRSHTFAARTRAKLHYRLPFLEGYKMGLKKRKIVILGTGWSSMHFLKYLSPKQFDITVVSPRNYFTFTPLLPSVAAGTLSPLSCIEPVRHFIRSKDIAHSIFYEAAARDVDFEKQEVSCVTEGGDEFTIDYDYLVIGIGADTNTFGIPGVQKYALMLKEVEHAIRFRKTVMNHFERASLPSVSDAEKGRLLHFVAVGAGPTGVETMAELSDFIKDDMSKHFPDLMQYVRLTLIEMTSSILPMFSSQVSTFTIRTLLRHQKINVLLQHVVTKVRQKSIEIERRESGLPKQVQNISYGVLLWATGVANTALGKKLLTQIPEQYGHRVLKTNHQLRLLGMKNVYAIGDCKQIIPEQMKNHVNLFIEMNHGEIPSSEWFRKHSSSLSKTFPQIAPQKYNFWKNPLRREMSQDQLGDYLESIDKNYRTPLPTAQSARQEGLYLACLFNEFGNDDEDRERNGCAFVDRWWGALAYVGCGRAVASLPRGWDVLGGWWSFPLWKTLYLVMQLSIRSRFIVAFDWFKVWACGRDVGRDHVYIPGELILVKEKPSESDDEREVEVTPPLTRALSTKMLDMVT